MQDGPVILQTGLWRTPILPSARPHTAAATLPSDGGEESQNMSVDHELTWRSKVGPSGVVQPLINIVSLGFFVGVFFTTMHFLPI